MKKKFSFWVIGLNKNKKKELVTIEANTHKDAVDLIHKQYIDEDVVISDRSGYE